MIVASGEVLACFRLRGGLSGKLRLDSSAKHCALLSVFGSRSIVFVLLSPGRIPSELLVVSAAGGLSVRGVQKSSVTCQLVPLASPERDLTDAATFTSARRDPGAVQSKVNVPSTRKVSGGSTDFLRPEALTKRRRWSHSESLWEGSRAGS